MDSFKLRAIIMLFILLNSQLAFAENGLEECITSQTVNSTGQQKELTQDAYSALKDIQADGFKINNLGPVQEQSDLDANITPELMIEQTSDTEGIPMEVPREIFYFTDIPHLLNTTYRGPYAMGVLLEDTLRTGRCDDMEYFHENGYICPVVEGLEYRNSGEGLVNDFERIGERIETLVSQIGTDEENYDSFIGGSYNLETFDTEFQERLKEDLAMSSKSIQESLQPVIKKRTIEEDLIQNHIRTEEFDASLEGNIMNEPQAVVEVYSMFDKYFNTWFTMDIVFSSFGPTLLGKAKDLVKKPLVTRSWGKKIYDSLGLTSLAKQKRLINKATSLASDAARKEFNEQVTKICMDVKARNFYLSQKYPKAGAVLNEIVNKKVFKSSGSTRNYLAEVADKIKKMNVDEQGALYEMVANVEKAGQYNVARMEMGNAIINTAKAETKAAVDAGTMTAADAAIALEEAQLKGLKEKLRSVQGWDDMMDFDMPEFSMQFPRGEFDKYGFKQNDIPAIFLHSWTFKSGKGILHPYYAAVDDAVAKGLSGKAFIEHVNLTYKTNLEKLGYSVATEVGSDGITRYGLAMYDAVPYYSKGVILNSELPNRVSSRANQSIIGPTGEQQFLTKNIADKIAKSNPTGKTELYGVSFNPTPDFALTPQQIQNRYLENFLDGRPKKIQDAFEQLKGILTDEGASLRNRRTLNFLDEVFSKNMKDIKDIYINPKTALLKWTGGSIAYWQARKGFEDFGLGIASAIMLPESWGSFRTSYKDDLIYKDAYIDFFVNHGSDDGDMLARMVNSPIFSGYKFILDSLSNYTEDKTGSQLPMVENTKVNNGRRTEVQDIVAFTYITEQTCADCSLDLKTENVDKTGSYADILFTSDKLLKTKIMENTQKRESLNEAYGSVLIAFAHHLDLDSDQGGEKIDIAKASTEGESCKQKAKFLGINIGTSEIGAVIGIAENLSYVLNFGFGIMTSVAMQLTVAQELQDCIDTEEGYFIYMFAPFKIDESQGQQAVDLKEEKSQIAYNVIQNIDDLIGESTGTTAIDAAKDKIKEVTKILAYKAMVNTTLQASLDAKGNTEGVYNSNRLVMLWFSGNAKANLNKYDTETEIKLWDNEHSVVVDKKTDKLIVDGKEIEAGEDIARMGVLDPESSSYVLPMRLGALKLDASDNTIFKINIYGEAEVLSESIYDCLKKIVEDQSGLTIESKNLTHVFGTVQGVDTETHNIGFDIEKDEISANGTPRIVATKDPEIIIKANAGTYIEGQEGSQLVGLIASIQFENGTMIYNNDTKELIVYLRHHNAAVLEQDDVEGLKIGGTTVQGEDCPEPAINLEAIANPDSEKSKAKVTNFNLSMEEMGPFQILETETKIYMFYSKLEEDGECHDYFKILDKETGETIYEGELSGPITNTENGIEFQTTDGRTHTIDADAHNGVPTVSYNGDAQETLLKAQGPNGAFWYNPETGMWYPENGYMIPLDSAFKQGFLTTKENGEITTSATGNILNVNLGAESSNPLNLPSLPLQDLGIYLLLMIAVIGVVYTRFIPSTKKKTS